MKRSRWALLLGICVVIAFIIQFIFYLIFARKFVGSGFSFVDDVENSRIAIKIFLTICAKYDAAVVPVNQQTLEGFNKHGAKYADHFINENKDYVVSFMTFNEVFGHKVVDSLVDSGFYHSSISQPDAKLISQNIVSHLTLHHIFAMNTFAVHVIVCYHRDGNFWWHGIFDFNLLNPPLHPLLKAEYFHFTPNEGAYDEFPLTSLMKDKLKIYLPSNITTFLGQMTHSSFIECNHTRSNLFYNIYKMDTSEDAMTFRALVWKMLRMTKTALGKIGVRFWLSSGTCLGYFRQCDIFPYGKDVDIGVWIKDYNPLIIINLLATGMNLKHKLGKVNDSLELSFVYEGIKLDIFFFYEEESYVWNGGLQTKSGKKFKYIFPKFDLCWTEFLSLKVSVPCQTESYITANYGPDWFKPVETWDWKTSPFNVNPNGVWPEDEWDEVIQVANFN